MTDQDDWSERLKGLILDENQVVTYKVASRELGVHVNTAKQMLFALSEDNKDLLDVLYLVAGRKADGRLTVKVCSDVDNHGLESVTSKHVYALGPKGKAKTRDAISADTVNPTLPSKHAAIGNKKAVPRQRVQGQEEPKKAPAPTVEAKSTKPAVKSEPVTTSAPSQQAKAATNGAAAAKPPVKTGSSGIKGSSLKGMFEKAAANRKTVKKEESSSVKKDETSPGKENRINEEKERKASKENGVASKKRSKKDSSSSVNKRRRIQVMSDSDSDGSEGGDVNVEREEEEEESQSAPPQAKLIQSDSEDDDVVPPTPDAGRVGKPQEGSRGLAAAKRARVKKRVTKTYVDESGFLCTKQEMQSCSESEEETDKKASSCQQIAKSDADAANENQSKSPSKKTTETSTAAKAKPVTSSSSSGTKQASIMNFFEKKS